MKTKKKSSVCFVQASGGKHPNYFWLASPDIERAIKVAGITYNEAFFDGLITQVRALPPQAKTTIHTSNEIAVKLVNGVSQVKEYRLIPLVKKVKKLLRQRPHVRIAFMPKPELEANIRAIKTEIKKQEDEAAIHPDYSAH